jgi:ornithine cyclodeaminase/alanine dehydrogenase-like protein (mu-crystallin family)
MNCITRSEPVRRARGDMTPVLLLTRRDIAAVIVPRALLDAVEDGFAALATGRADVPAPLHIPSDDGGFHAKAAGYRAARHWVALKLNANFPGNPVRRGLPTIQGAILLLDGSDGRLLAILDSIELTLRRTAAATALAARHLARALSSTLAVCGCGAQARPHIDALTGVLPVRRVLLWDIDPQAAQHLRDGLVTGDGTFAVEVSKSLEQATAAADVIVTCTPSRRAFLGRAAVRPGCFIAAVGADNPAKSEIEPELMAASSVVVDSRLQCATMGDLHHAIAANAMSAEQVHAELGEIVLGAKAGRRRDDETWLFDSTGVAVQDVAAAAHVYERATALGVGSFVDLSGA